MRHNYALPESVLLSVAGAWGSVSCLITAFELPVERTAAIGWIWLGFAILCGLLLPMRWGTMALTALCSALLGFAFFCGNAAMDQLSSFLGAIARAYDSGYGWGIPSFLQVAQTSAEIPVLMLGMALIFAVSRGLCRRKRTAPAAVCLMLPLCACLVLTDTVPARSSLFVLLLDVILLMLTAWVRRESRAQASKLCFAALIPTALSLSLLFALVPQEGYVDPGEKYRERLAEYAAKLPEMIQSIQIAAPRSGRIREQVNLASLSAQPRLRIPVAEVTVEQPGAYYLRGRDYDVYTGASWQSTANRQETLAGTGDGRGTVTVQILNEQKNMLIPSFPDGETILIDGLAENAENSRVYTILCRSGIIGPQPGESWLTLPQSTMARARELLAGIPGDKSTTDAVAAAVADYVSGCAVYDRETRAMPGGKGDFALWFLEEADRGYCVHFATAAAVLLRSAGIPARYVTGYYVEAKDSGTVQVTSDDAHAWVEYYNYKTWTWTILEATPGEPELAPPEPTQAQTEPATAETTRPKPETRPTEATTAATEPAPTQPSAPTRHRPPMAPVYGIAGLLCIVLAAEGQRLTRIRLRRRRQLRGGSNQQALACWQELGVLFRLLKTRMPEELIWLAERARFSQHTLTEDELNRFRECAAASRRALQQRPWYKKWIYRYWYAVI